METFAWEENRRSFDFIRRAGATNSAQDDIIIFGFAESQQPTTVVFTTENTESAEATF